MRLATGIALAVLVAALFPAAVGAGKKEDLGRAAELIDAGETESALALLDRLISAEPEAAEAYHLRSTVQFMIGDTERGRRDLDRSLELDPGLRDAWLTRAALDISEESYDRALEALHRARELDPEAPDNALNIGAVLVLQGKLQEASGEFAAYLERNPASAEAYFLVATNYAMEGYAALATEHLARAIQLDERSRLRARTDPNFAGFESNARFQDLLLNDAYRPPPGAHVATRTYDEPWAANGGRLLAAVIDALQFSGFPFDHRVEVTPGWALIWSEFRIKVAGGAEGKGVVELTAPADRYTPAEWKERSEELFRQISARLTSLRGLKRSPA